MTEVIDAEVVGQELEPRPETAATLFRTDDPVTVIERASAAADALKDVLTKQRLTASIKGREHVLVEGWTTLGSMLGVVPVVEWTRPIEDKGWEARVEARTLDGRVVGAAEAECLRSESRWKSADDYALRSMAQTRATSKALRGPLGFVVTLAGFSATPAEEMPAEGGGAGAASTPVDAAAVPSAISPERQKDLRKLFDRSPCTAGELKLALISLGITATSVNDGLAKLDEEKAVSLENDLTRRIEGAKDA